MKRSRRRSFPRFRKFANGYEPLEEKRLLAADGADLARDSFEVQQNSRDLTFDVLVNDSFDDDYAGDKLITDVSLGSARRANFDQRRG